MGYVTATAPASVPGPAVTGKKNNNNKVNVMRSAAFAVSAAVLGLVTC